jgi:hypothetical protein
MIKLFFSFAGLDLRIWRLAHLTGVSHHQATACFFARLIIRSGALPQIRLLFFSFAGLGH